MFRIFTYQVIYDHLPRQRQLDSHVRKEAESLIKMKVNKKLLQQHLSETTGKIVTLKDVSNIQISIHRSDESVETVVDSLRETEGKKLMTSYMHSIIIFLYFCRSHC